MQTAAARTGWTLGALFALALLTSAPVWWLHAWPVLTMAAVKSHVGHYGPIYLHALGGTFMLVAGAGALFIGHTRKAFHLHRWFGYAYLIGGSVGACAALYLSVFLSHAPVSLGVATGTLAVFWLAFAAMAWRAARNRRFDSHREWVIRSYVLTWTFVGCRIAQLVPPFPALGQEGVTAGIWLYWIAPILVCEMCLQWRRGSKSAG